MIADYIESELLPLCDFVADLHSGGSSLEYIPSALGRRPDTPQGMDEMLTMLRSLARGCYLVDTPEAEIARSPVPRTEGVRYLGPSSAAAER